MLVPADGSGLMSSHSHPSRGLGATMAALQRRLECRAVLSTLRVDVGPLLEQHLNYFLVASL